MSQQVRRNELAKPFQLFLGLSGVLWFVAILFSVYYRYIRGWTAYYWHPLMPTPVFPDILFYADKAPLFHTSAFFDVATGRLAYPAGALLLLQGFYLFHGHALAAILTFIVLVIAGLSCGVVYALCVRGMELRWAAFLVASTLLLSYPFIFELQRANVEIANLLILSLAVYAYWRQMWKTAAILIGLGAIMKGFPFIFLGLLVAAKKWLATVYAILIMVVGSLLATWAVGPTYTEAAAGIRSGLEFFRVNCIEILWNPAWDHSLFALVKFLTFRHHGMGPGYYSRELAWYIPVMAVAGLILFWWKIRFLPRTNQVAILSVITILIPPMSYDYTLMLLYIPWTVLALYRVRYGDRNQRTLLIFFGLLALATSPDGFLFLAHVKIGGQFKCFVLFVLTWMLIRHPLPEATSDQNPQALTA